MLIFSRFILREIFNFSLADMSLPPKNKHSNKWNRSSIQPCFNCFKVFTTPCLTWILTKHKCETCGNHSRKFYDFRNKIKRENNCFVWVGTHIVHTTIKAHIKTQDSVCNFFLFSFLASMKETGFLFQVSDYVLQRLISSHIYIFCATGWTKASTNSRRVIKFSVESLISHKQKLFFFYECTQERKMKLRLIKFN